MSSGDYNQKKKCKQRQQWRTNTNVQVNFYLNFTFCFFQFRFVHIQVSSFHLKIFCWTWNWKYFYQCKHGEFVSKNKLIVSQVLKSSPHQPFLFVVFRDFSYLIVFGFIFYRNNNKCLSDSEYILHQCQSRDTQIVNWSYIILRYSQDSLTGSEIWNFSFSLKFYLVLDSLEYVFSWYNLHYKCAVPTTADEVCALIKQLPWVPDLAHGN